MQKKRKEKKTKRKDDKEKKKKKRMKMVKKEKKKLAQTGPVDPLVPCSRRIRNWWVDWWEPCPRRFKTHHIVTGGKMQKHPFALVPRGASQKKQTKKEVKKKNRKENMMHHMNSGKILWTGMKKKRKKIMR